MSRLGGTAIFAAALAWLLKGLINHWLRKDIELYKQRLASVAELELERQARLRDAEAAFQKCLSLGFNTADAQSNLDGTLRFMRANP